MTGARSRRPRLRKVLHWGSLVLSACVGDRCYFSDSYGTGPKDNACKGVLLVVDGDGQSASVGAGLARPLRVRSELRDGDVPCVGAHRGDSIVFTVSLGGGQVTPAWGFTDSLGYVSSQWTLGSVPGPQQVQASAPAPSKYATAPIFFNATANDKPFRLLRIIAGNNVRVSPGNAVAPDVELVARQPNGSDVPVAGTTITWSVTGGGGTVTPTTANTTVAGRANATWTLGASLGQQTLRAVAGASSGVAADPRDVLQVDFAATAATIAVDTVAVTGPTSLVAGSAGQYTATMRDAARNVLTGRTVTWALVPTGLADLTFTGANATVTARRVGVVSLRATSEGVTGTIDIAITPGALANVSVAPPNATVSVGSNTTFTATALDAEGNALPNQTFTWASSNATVASVVGGVATGLAQGSTTISATTAGKTGTATLLVTAAAGGPPARIAYAVSTHPSSGTYTANPAFSYNSSGGPITITNLGPGSYRVSFGSQTLGAGEAISVFATAYNATSGGFCKVASRGNNPGQVLEANVSCFDLNGTLTSMAFSVLLLGNDVLTGRFAFGEANQPGPGPSYAAANAYPPGATRPRVARAATGIYDVTFPGNGGSANEPEGIMVTATGNGAERCHAGERLVGEVLRVRCWAAEFDVDQPADATFVFTMITRGRTGRRVAYAYIDDGPPVAAPGQSVNVPVDAGYNSANGNASISGVQVKRTAPGEFDVTFSGLAPAGATLSLGLQVVDQDEDDSDSCSIVGWQRSGSDLVAQVRCFHSNGNLDDDAFFIMVIE